MLRSKKAIVIPAAVIIALVAVYFLVSFYIMSTVLTAERSEFEDRPESLGLTYEEVEFSPRDWPELTLRGWWLPAEAPLGSVIQVHGLDSNRAARLELTQAMVENRYSVLTFDLRGNGESDDAQMGASVHEQDDVLGAVDYLLEERGIEPRTILLYGVSYGAAVVLQAGAREPAVTGVFADSSFASLSDMVVQEVDTRSIVPAWGAAALRPGIILMGRLFRGIDVGEVRPADAVAAYDYPLGLAHCRADERISIRHLAQIRQGVQAAPWMTVYESCAHGDAWMDYTDHYEAVLLDYYDERVGL